MNNKVDTTIANGFVDIEEWHSNGLYKDWFGFNVGDEKIIEFRADIANNRKFGLQTFKDNYIPRDDYKEQISLDFITIKTTCMAISPNSRGLLRTHAVGIWKIEFVKEQQPPKTE